MPGTLPLGQPWPKDNTLAPVDSDVRSFHAYVHIPFCEVRCGYCDFNTYTQDEIGSVSKSSFHHSLIQEIEFSSKVIENSSLPARKLSSVFFGGGTPSLFETEQVRLILDALSERFGFDSNCEITLEANPESLRIESLKDLRAAGVDRISLGAQSFDRGVLAVLDRIHDPGKVAPLVQAAKSEGFRVSVDLIYGAPGETLESWHRTLQEAISLGTTHISAYSLIVEPGTKLSRLIRSGQLGDVDEDLNAEKYELLTSLTEQAGLEWYEISNFGDPSIHNLAYWNSQDWWGFGPGAHSHIAGNRFWNRKHPSAYQTALGEASSVQAMERLTQQQTLEEKLMLGLRTKFGVARSLFTKLSIDPERVAEQIAAGFLTTDGQRVYLTSRGRLLADRLVVNFLSQ